MLYFTELSQRYTTRWWFLALRGLLYLAFGILLMLLPWIGLNLLIYVVALGCLIDGLNGATAALLGRTIRPLARIMFLKHLIQMAFGAFIFAYPTLVVHGLILLVGGLLFFRGALEYISLIETMRLSNHRLLWMGPAVFMALGLLTLFSPFSDYHAIALFFGLYAVLEGLARMGSAFHMSDLLARNEGRVRLSRAARELGRILPPLAKGDLLPEMSNSLLHLDLRAYRRIVAFVPHPDDLEGFIGGLAYLAPAHFTQIIFCGGDRGIWRSDYRSLDSQAYIQIRLEEADDAAQLLGIAETRYLGYRDRQLVCDEDAIEQVLAILRELEPDCVISFEYHKRATPYAHADHLAMAEIVRRAVARYERHDALDFLLTSTLLPNRFLDVTAVRRVKLAALACHISQIELTGAIFPLFEKTLTRLWGLCVGVRYAEGYRRVDVDAMLERLDEAA
ncbi:MAG: PIG-L family deacetylase [Anaerolineae bacterium]|nr:PIG-L family deacetylase [Anaerolineae bacterium]MDW8173762.1 PIG-L family deacetylase [Anaerolineae bacterium]